VVRILFHRQHANTYLLCYCSRAQLVVRLWWIVFADDVANAYFNDWRLRNDSLDCYRSLDAYDERVLPNPIAVAAGATVTWTNNDNVTHTSTSDTNLWNSGSIAPQGSFSRMFPSAGTFSYHCSIHPGMVATVTVQ
jgi:hypothetical protein